MTPEISRLLDSSNPQDRKRAIKLMAQSADSAALPYLAALYKTDSDPEIRDLAVQAGRYIRKQQEEVKWQGKPPKEGTPAEEPKEEVRVSEGDRRRSQELIDRAMQRDIANDKRGAFELAQKAVKINPNIVNEAYYGGIISDITGQRGEDALEVLLGGKDKPKRKNDMGGTESEVTWGDALLNLVIIGVVIGGATIVANILLPLLLQPITSRLLEAIANNPGSPFVRGITENLGTFYALSTADVPTSVISGLSAGVQIIFSILIGYTFLHFVAKFLMGGDGTFPELIQHTTIYQLVTGVVGIFGGYLVVYLYVNNTFDAIIGLINGTLAPSNYDPSLGGGVLSGTGLLSLLGFISIFWFASAIGKAYRFSTTKGCLTIVAVGIVATLLLCGLSAVFGASLASLTGGFTP